jgi:sugar/nucleoside kinase (ribokinase family)
MPFLMADYAFLSTEDTPDADTFACKYSSGGPATVVTAGAAGARLYRHGELSHTVRPVPAHEVDPTGAGDCFLAAFVVRLLECGDEREAGQFAAASAAIAVEGSGIASIPSREQVQSRFREVAA